MGNWFRAVSLSLALFIAWMLLPPALPVLMIAPAPLFLASVTGGLLQALLAAVAGAGVIAASMKTTAPSAWIIYALVCGNIGLALGIARMGTGPALRRVIQAWIIASVATVSVTALALSTGAFNPAAWMDKIASAAQLSAGDKAEFLRLAEFMTRNIYAVVVALVGIACFLSYRVAVPMARWFGAIVEPMPPFAQWRLPEPLIFALLAAGFGHMIGEKAAIPGLSFFSENLFWLSAGLYCMGGLALTRFFLEGNPWAVWAALAAFIFFWRALWQIVAIIAVADVWIDFRKKVTTDEVNT